MSGNRNKDQGYAIGYGKPPKATRFTKGRSGNSRGRPRGTRNFTTDLDEVLKTPMPITENGRKKTVSTQLAALLRLREKALKGDPRALEKLLAFAAARSDERAAQNAERSLTEREEAIIERFREDTLRQVGALDGSPQPGGADDERD